MSHRHSDAGVLARERNQLITQDGGDQLQLLAQPGRRWYPVIGRKDAATIVEDLGLTDNVTVFTAGRWLDLLHSPASDDGNIRQLY